MIIGVARSGTSILGEILATHPDIYFSFEPDLLWRVAAEKPGRLIASDLTIRGNEIIHKFLERTVPPDKIYLEKNPWCVLRIPYIYAALPDIKLIHIVRDGRDVACSMLPGGIKHLQPPGWKALKENFSGVELYARLWQQAIEIALEDLQQVPHIQVKYEDLVSDAWNTVVSILDFLDLEHLPAIEEYCKLVTNETANAYHAKRQDVWYVDNHTTRVQRYKENMTAEEISKVNLVIDNTLKKLGYGGLV